MAAAGDHGQNHAVVFGEGGVAVSGGCQPSSEGKRVAVVGGGLAGMAAALALVENGCRVDLFEQKHRLGGRVGSFHDPRTGEQVDYCMHVAMGCCTNFLDFIRRTGVEDCFQRHRRLTFIGPNGDVCKFTSWPWLPAPLHLLPGFARLRYLTLGERLSIARCLMRLGRLKADDRRDKTAGEWLREQRQSQRTIDRFWSVILVSALGETVERVDLSMARKVFLDGFLRSAQGYEVLLPRIPLGEVFGRRVADRLRQSGVGIHLGSPVRSIGTLEARAESLTLADGRQFPFDALILAVPWTAIERLLLPEQRTLLHRDWDVQQIESSAITAVHLWFDREITSLPHAALVGRVSQWIFRHSPSEQASANRETSERYQVVISASQRLADLPGDELLTRVLGDLRSAFPKAKAARLLHHRIVTERNAVFSVTPEAQQRRLPTETGVCNVYLAGDWTQSGWPATMEGAVLSGYRAASMVVQEPDQHFPLPVGERKPSWLARMLFPRH